MGTQGQSGRSANRTAPVQSQCTTLDSQLLALNWLLLATTGGYDVQDLLLRFERMERTNELEISGLKVALSDMRSTHSQEIGQLEKKIHRVCANPKWLRYTTFTRACFSLDGY